MAAPAPTGTSHPVRADSSSSMNQSHSRPAWLLALTPELRKVGYRGAQKSLKTKPSMSLASGHQRRMILLDCTWQASRARGCHSLGGHLAAAASVQLLGGAAQEGCPRAQLQHVLIAPRVALLQPGV